MKFINKKIIRLISGLVVGGMLLAGCADSRIGGLMTAKKHVPLPDRGRQDVPARPIAEVKRKAAVSPEKMKPRPLPKKIEMLQVDTDFIKQRSSAYQDELEKWRKTVFSRERPPEGWTECLVALKRISGRYRKFQDKIKMNRTGVTTRNYQQLLQEDINFQASPCNSLARPTTNALNSAGCRQLEAALQRRSAEGNYQEVISLYEQLSDFSDDEISPEIMKFYAQALVKSGNPAAAAEVLIKLEKKYGSYSPRLMGRQAARLFLAAGNTNAAVTEYDKLLAYYDSLRKEEPVIREQLDFLRNPEAHSRELSWFSAVLRGSLLFNGRHLSREMIQAMTGLNNYFPETIYTEKAGKIYTSCEERMRDWVGRQLDLVEKLVSDKQFDRAREVLTVVGSGPLPVDFEEQASRLDRRINMSREQEEERRQQLIAHARNVQWQEGMNLLDSRQYDEAIAVFTALLEADDYREEAEKQISAAKRQAAVDLRRQAAGLFIKAGKTADPQLKGEFLLEARQTLLEILTKYSQVDIIDKVRENLKVIEGDILQLDPGLLEQEQTSPTNMDKT